MGVDPNTDADADRPDQGVPTFEYPASELVETASPQQTVTSEAIGAKRSWRDRLRPAHRDSFEPAQEPYDYTHLLRFTMATLMGVLCLLTVGGAIVMLLLWQQDRASGVLTSQLDRTWSLFDTFHSIERWVAFAVVLVAMAWIALATINARRATGQQRNPAVAAASLLVGLLGVWIVGAQIVTDSDNWLTTAIGIVLQALMLLIPLLALERVADAAEAIHRPLRATYLLGVAYLIVLQTLGGLSSIESTADSDQWGKYGAYLAIGAVIMVWGTLSANEAARSIEEGSDHRFQLRQKFDEALLAQPPTTDVSRSAGRPPTLG